MDVPSRYFRDAKPALLGLVDPRGLRVLDLGCGGGHNGELFKKAGAREVVGVERDAGAAAEARRRLDRVVESDLAELDPAELGDRPFDVVLASDVLEHLIDAEGVLARAVAVLRPGGAVVLSLPNVSNVYVFSQLLLKTWPRRRSGIFDRTHVRWFAKRDMIRLLEGAGLTVLRVEPYFTRFRAIRYASLVLSLYVFRDYWARQFLLLAVKPGGAATRPPDEHRRETSPTPGEGASPASTHEAGPAGGAASGGAPSARGGD
ncbi:MAG TPA: class I SAM-dependent methyltransferase [Thermoleophilia bacterium]|nr:class I SAM-dependent methyltransferase [Thermoleophilia bacterium]